MVLPPYVYLGDWRETQAHFSAIISATPLSCMLYNNPIAYGTDLSALADNRIAVTPLKLDLTDEPFMKKLADVLG